MFSTQPYVLITGATSGIGYELAKVFASNGYNLVIVARKELELEKTATELQRDYLINVIAIAKDLFERQASFEVYQYLKERGVDIEILVNDAGQGQYGEFVDTDIYRELDIIQLNISSLVILTKLYLKDMVAAGRGRILNVASIASKLPGPYQAVYHATKAFVHSFSEAIRSEVKEKGVVVTSLLPGATDTDFFVKADMLASPTVQEGDLADPAEVAQDGYEALMNGDDMVVSGLNNKLRVAMSNLTPDETLADNRYAKGGPTK